MNFARIAGTTLLLIGIAVGTSACVADDGSVTIPDRGNLPSITLPTRPPAPEADPAPPAAEPEAPPAAEPKAPPAADPEVPITDEGVYDAERGSLWPFFVIVVLGVGALIVGRIHGAARREWNARLSTARTHISWVEGSLAPQVLAASTTSEAAALWTAAGPRVLEVDEQLHALESEAKDEAARERVTRLRQPYGFLVAALSAETSTTSATLADELRATRIQVELARQAVRAALPPTA